LLHFAELVAAYERVGLRVATSSLRDKTHLETLDTVTKLLLRDRSEQHKDQIATLCGLLLDDLTSIFQDFVDRPDQPTDAVARRINALFEDSGMRLDEAELKLLTIPPSKISTAARFRSYETGDKHKSAPRRRSAKDTAKAALACLSGRRGEARLFNVLKNGNGFTVRQAFGYFVTATARRAYLNALQAHAEREESRAVDSSELHSFSEPDEVLAAVLTAAIERPFRDAIANTTLHHIWTGTDELRQLWKDDDRNVDRILTLARQLVDLALEALQSTRTFVKSLAPNFTEPMMAAMAEQCILQQYFAGDGRADEVRDKSQALFHARLHEDARGVARAERALVKAIRKIGQAGAARALIAGLDAENAGSLFCAHPPSAAPS
jgi:hypothetical protein